MRKVKPGPKSYHERQLRRTFDLGESSASDINTSTTRQGSSDSEFRSPENAGDDTDYGLNFTSSRLSIANPRRCSTLANARELQTLSPRRASARLQNSPRTSSSGQQTNKSPAKSISAKTTRQSSSQQQETSPSTSRDARRRTLQTINEERNENPRRPTQQHSQSENQENVAPQSTQRKERGAKRRKRKDPQTLLRRFVREVLHLQASTAFMIPRGPFGKLVRELMNENTQYVTHITREALEALQTATEMYITQRLQDAYLLTLHRNRVTITVQDLRLLNTLRNSI